jgi:hypothetical protein
MGQQRDDASSGVAPFGYEPDLTRGSAEISKNLAALAAGSWSFFVEDLPASTGSPLWVMGLMRSC